ncbi:MAG: TonB-dependent receptor, partial [Chthoniobacterales bacterium]
NSSAPFTVHEIDATELRRAPELRLDDVLRAEVPGFSLFRRNSSRTANPTTQGVTLRNFGPSGAGRTLVLLDGIPLNDPFAGYVLWSQLPTAEIESVLVQPGGGGGLFGNAALAGTIFVTSEPLEQNALTLSGVGGDHDTYELAGYGAFVQRPNAIALFAERFSTGGYQVVAKRQRGPVDTDASSESDLVDLSDKWQIGPDTTLRLRGRWFDDERGNGTPYTRNDTEGEDGSATLVQQFRPQSAELQLNIYGQHRRFRSTFSSINDRRTVETPALDQFNVPADALGGSAVWSMVAHDHRVTLGADARAIEGETDEFFSWNGSRFTRLREAGGDQLFLGVFAEDTWIISPGLTIVGGVRYDHWELSDGFRKETVRDSGAHLANKHFADRDGDEINGRLGARWSATRTLAFRAAGYSGFRVPTLNELYRPFRVGNDVTEANPELKPEQLLGGEVAAEWQTTQTLRITATGFINRLEDAVANITIGFGPGTFNPGGFIPRGGVLRQRQNIDLVCAPGAEIAATWQIVPALALRANYLFTHPTVERATDPALEGKLLAQTPENTVTAGLAWTPNAHWSFNAQFRYTDRQFEDDQNVRVLAPCTAVDASAVYQVSSHLSAGLRVENIFNTEIETGKTANGVLSIGAPRLLSAELRWEL